MGVAVLVTLMVAAWNAIAPALLAPRSVDQSVSGAVTQPATSRPAARGAAVAALEPSIAAGRRELGDSMYAVRDGGQVTVFFDTDTLRTRLDWKFEGVVRATLPLVFGSDVRMALDSIAAGTFVRGGHLMNDLPTRGIPLKVGSHSLRVWPITRQGRDGPLVVGYRAAAAR